MSKLAQYREIERKISELLNERDRIKESKALQKDIEFSEALDSLVREYSMSPAQVLDILFPARSTTEAKPGRRTRAPRTYRNPHTGETVVTKGGNHKTIQSWKAEHGTDAVSSWVIRS